MAYIPGSETHPLSDAVSVSNNRVFNVVQVADPAGNLVDPSAGGGGGGGGDASAANQLTIIGHVDGIEGLLTTIDADTGSIDGKLPALQSGAIPVVGSVAVRTPTTTSVASSASSVTILASNADRKGLSISNISTAKLYLSFTNPATTANCFIEVPAGAFLLFDQQLIVTNAIYGIWASANGTAQVTEYV